MVAVDDATPTLGAASACRVLGLPRASLYRGRRPVAVARPRPAPPRALDPIERQGILDLLHTRFIDRRWCTDPAPSVSHDRPPSHRGDSRCMISI